MERSKASTNKRSPDGLSHTNQNTIIINKIWKYFIRHRKSIMKFNSKNKIDLNNQKMTNHLFD